MRMLLSQPKALLLDEAFSGLDADLREQIRALVFTRARVQNLPVVMVTHDPADAEAAAGPVIHIG
jgi:putative thiamine transport system ATP-binding protein